MKIVRHWIVNRKGKRVFLGRTGGKGTQIKFRSGNEAKLVLRSLTKVLETAEPDAVLQELFQKGVDTMFDSDVIVKTPEPIGCGHGRPSPSICPHCLGLNEGTRGPGA